MYIIELNTDMVIPQFSRKISKGFQKLVRAHKPTFSNAIIRTISPVDNFKNITISGLGKPFSGPQHHLKSTHCLALVKTTPEYDSQRLAVKSKCTDLSGVDRSGNDIFFADLSHPSKTINAPRIADFVILLNYCRKIKQIKLHKHILISIWYLKRDALMPNEFITQVVGSTVQSIIKTNKTKHKLLKVDFLCCTFVKLTLKKTYIYNLTTAIILPKLFGDSRQVTRRWRGYLNTGLSEFA
ncbi:hypothetical protein AGLY_002887 [Aphis glycines]|uniref:Uncharacterized protein n=1 Tax=Aphis glycines TaxID=307491 RepID=A0A6G0U426_APHGL|nr:hypothetical protein AGLY_002887 [Aphis glycines]